MNEQVVYQVWSEHVDLDASTNTQVLETRRTSKTVAHEDRDLIQSILHRKSWVQEVQA